MTDKRIQNYAQSVRDKLKNISNETNQDYNSLCSSYAAERLLYRLSISEHRDRLVEASLSLQDLDAFEVLHSQREELEAIAEEQSLDVDIEP